MRVRRRRWRKVGELFCESRMICNPKWMTGPEPLGTANSSDSLGATGAGSIWDRVTVGERAWALACCLHLHPLGATNS